MFKLTEASTSAILVAMIAALASLLGLIISKEQKTSEFRQAWIDALRSDFAVYLAQINAIHDSVKIPYSTHKELSDAVKSNYLALNTANFAILLRINPDEDKFKKIMNAMDSFQEMAASEVTLNVDNIRKAEAVFISCAQDVLRSEWKRVKDGEVTFRIAKILAALVVAGGIGLVVFAFGTQGTGGGLPGSAKTVTIPAASAASGASPSAASSYDARPNARSAQSSGTTSRANAASTSSSARAKP